MTRFSLCQARADVDGLAAELEKNNAELRELRASWTERETRIEQLETQRVFYEEELSAIGHQYQAPSCRGTPHLL